MSNFMDTYVDVAERIRQLREKYPDATLQPADPSKPFWIEDVPNIGPRLVYVAACYRTADDQRPGIGMAWEPLPGLTPFTKGSELMVAETSAWGRAIVAALAADTQKVASADEVRNRQSSDNLREIARPNPKPAQSTTTITQMPKPAAKQGGVATEAQRKYAKALLSQVGNDDTLIADLTGGAGIEQLSAAQAKQVIQDLLAIKKGEATLSYDGDGKATVSYKS
jgi:hypothetical protein